MLNANIFTIESVNAMIPRLSELMGRQFDRRSDIELRLRALSELAGEIPDNLSPIISDSPEIAALKRDLTARVEQYQTGWGEIESTGAVLKDPKLGLVDFYGRIDGKLVWLCWKYGEEKVSHYHALDEGYSSRKAIESGIRKHLLN